MHWHRLIPGYSRDKVLQRAGGAARPENGHNQIETTKRSPHQKKLWANEMEQCSRYRWKNTGTPVHTSGDSQTYNGSDRMKNYKLSVWTTPLYLIRPCVCVCVRLCAVGIYRLISGCAAQRIIVSISFLALIFGPNAEGDRKTKNRKANRRNHGDCIFAMSVLKTLLGPCISKAIKYNIRRPFDTRYNLYSVVHIDTSTTYDIE